jgi:hypothetical protein
MSSLPTIAHVAVMLALYAQAAAAENLYEVKGIRTPALQAGAGQSYMATVCNLHETKHAEVVIAVCSYSDSNANCTGESIPHDLTPGSCLSETQAPVAGAVGWARVEYPQTDLKVAAKDLRIGFYVVTDSTGEVQAATSERRPFAPK